MSESSENLEKWLKINLKVKEKQIIEGFQFLIENEIEPILIKGRAAAEYYPQKFDRQFVDSDLCVAPEQYQKAKELLRKNSPSVGLIDLHKGLRDHDTLDWKNLFENSILLEIDNYEIRVLRPEDHLRVLCVHWLTDGGGYKNRLFDIYWLVKNRGKNFDWERCLGVVDKNRRRWIICVIGIAHKYLDLEIDDLPFADEAENLPKWLTKTLEKEWQSDVRVLDFTFNLEDPKFLFQQLKKRFPPNPITSIVMSEGSFDSRTRAIYQIKNFYERLTATIKKRWKRPD